MFKVSRIIATFACSALAMSLVVGGAIPVIAADQNSVSEKNVAADLNMGIEEYQDVKELAAKNELEIWAGGKKLVSSQERNSSLNFADAAAYKAQTWGACGVKTDAYKHVRTWQVATVPYAGGAAVLKCGTWSASYPDRGWGYRHVYGKHGNQWKQLGALVGANWRDVADFAISDSMRNIYSAKPQVSNNTYQYKGIVQLKKYNGSVVKTYYTTIPVTTGDRRIITAYYRSTK